MRVPEPVADGLKAVAALRQTAQDEIVAGGCTFERYNFLVGLVAGYREAEAAFEAAGKDWAAGREREND